MSHPEIGLGSSCKLGRLYGSVTMAFRVARPTVELLSQLSCVLIHCENRAPSCALSTDMEGWSSLSLDLRNLGEVCSQDGEHLLFSWLQDNKIHFKILGCSCFTDQERRGCFRCLIWLAAVVQICSGCFFCSSVNTSRNRKGLMPKKETSKVPKLESIWHQNRL